MQVEQAVEDAGLTRTVLPVNEGDRPEAYLLKILAECLEVLDAELTKETMTHFMLLVSPPTEAMQFSTLPVTKKKVGPLGLYLLGSTPAPSTDQGSSVQRGF